MWLLFPQGMAIARRLVPFGVQRLLYSGRAAKAEAAEVKGEFGKKKCNEIHSAKVISPTPYVIISYLVSISSNSCHGHASG